MDDLKVDLAHLWVGIATYPPHLWVGVRPI